MRALGSRLGVAIASALATALVVEVVFRGLTATALPSLAPGAIAASVEAAREASLDPDAGADGGAAGAELPRVIPHPYLGWIGTPGLLLSDEFGRPDLRKMGYGNRLPEWVHTRRNNVGCIEPHDVPYAGGEDEYVVLVVGGSVARWFAVRGGRSFEAELEAQPGFEERDVVLLNGATGGHKQPQQLFTVLFYLALGQRLDAVVNIDGFNEAAFGSENLMEGVAAVYPPRRYWSNAVYGTGLSPEVARAIAAAVEARDARDTALARAERWAPWSNVVGAWYVRRAEALTVLAAERQVAYQDLRSELTETHLRLMVEGPAYRGELDPEGRVPRAEVVDVWARASEALAGACAAQGVQYLHVLQPTPHDSAGGPPKPFTPEELEDIGDPEHELARATRDLYPSLRARGAELASTGVPFEDLTPLFATYEAAAYYDHCHLTENANQVFARAIARALRARLP
jgi:hypothetical protein